MTEQEFWANVNKDGDGCWEWARCRNTGGYGQLALNKRMRLAHRVAWELANGAIPEGLMVCHHCDNPACCNPKHLFLGSAKDNAQDAKAKGRLPSYRANGLPKHAVLTAEQVAEIRAIEPGTVSVAELAARYGVSTPTIRGARKGQSWLMVPNAQPRLTSEERGAARRVGRHLRPADVAAIRAKYVPGVYSLSMLAREYGVDQSYVSYIVNGKRRIGEAAHDNAEHGRGTGEAESAVQAGA